jgi:hypothetical protein
MPHSKCMACRIRLYSPGGPADAVGELCPECGALLEPVGTLVEVVGFRRVTRREDTVAGGSGALARAVALQLPDPRL